MEHCVTPDGWPEFPLFLLALSLKYADFNTAFYFLTSLPSIYIQITLMKKMKRPNIKKLQKNVCCQNVCVHVPVSV